MYAMAGGGGAAAASTPSGAAASYLQVADATMVGTDIWSQTSDVITATIPVPASAVSTLGGANGCPYVLLWDLGPVVGTTGSLTVADLESVMVRLEVDTAPAGTDGRILIPFGVVFTASAIGSVDFTTAKSRWSSSFWGASGAPNSTILTSAQNNNLSPATGAASQAAATLVRADCSINPRSTIYEAKSTSIVMGPSAPSDSNNTNGDDLTATWYAYVFAMAGRAITSGSTLAPTFKLRAGAIRRTTP